MYFLSVEQSELGSKQPPSGICCARDGHVQWVSECI